jgi:hypothetical protein
VSTACIRDRIRVPIGRYGGGLVLAALRQLEAADGQHALALERI